MVERLSARPDFLSVRLALLGAWLGPLGTCRTLNAGTQQYHPLKLDRTTIVTSSSGNRASRQSKVQLRCSAPLSESLTHFICQGTRCTARKSHRGATRVPQNDPVALHPGEQSGTIIKILSSQLLSMSFQFGRGAGGGAVGSTEPIPTTSPDARIWSFIAPVSSS